MTTDAEKKQNGNAVPDTKEKDAKDEIKINPNPRANANVPDAEEKDKPASDGVGSEITDGEGG